MYALIEKQQEKQLTLDSREVAEMVEKKHFNLVRDIENYIQYLENSELSSQDFFIESSYKTEGNNKTYKCYEITRKGCEFVSNKLTGQKGTIFTATYINRFHDMEEELKRPKKLSAKEELRLHYQALEEQEEKILEIDNKVNELENNMPLFNVECKELQALVRKVGIATLGGYRSPAYNDNSLRGKVYADIQNQIKREFGVGRYEAIKRIQLDQAKEIVKSYKAPLILMERIQLENKQLILLKGDIING